MSPFFSKHVNMFTLAISEILLTCMFSYTLTVLLRTEIAVLKLVNHPNIIRLEGIYESRNNIYIVMEMLKGGMISVCHRCQCGSIFTCSYSLRVVTCTGELFERIVGRPRFTEQEAAKLIRPLLESVAYLHDLGIGTLRCVAVQCPSCFMLCFCIICHQFSSVELYL
jgi:serine/threonine protein kinase